MSLEIVLSDDDAMVEKDPKKRPRAPDNRTSIFIPDGDYGDEVIFVEPEDYSPKKKLKLDEEKRTAAIDASFSGTDSEITVLFDKKGIDFPHAREHCRVKKFVKNPTLTTRNAANEEFCEKCYCFVCDDLSSKCQSWKTGEKPHCNAYSKHAFWEQERIMHKRKKKKAMFVPILSLLSATKISQELTQTAIACNLYINQIQELSNSSYDMVTNTHCVCYCHADRFLDHAGCFNCEWQHRIAHYSKENSAHYGGYRVTHQLREIVSNATTLAESFLKRKQPNSAVLVLDTITSSLFCMDINSACTVNFSDGDLSRLMLCWIEAALNKNVEQDLLSKAKDRISNAAKDTSGVFNSQAMKLHRILSGLRSYDDPLLVKCLTPKHKGSSCLKEPHEVAKVRLKYFKANRKYTEAISYVLGVEVERAYSCSVQKLCDVPEQRDELVDLLLKKGQVLEAFNVCTIPFLTNLPADLREKPSVNGRTFNYYNTPLKRISFESFKKLFLGLVRPKNMNKKNAQGKSHKSPSSFFEEGLRNAMTITLPAIYVNDNLNSHLFFEFLFDVLSTQNKNYRYMNENVRKEVQLSASYFVNKRDKTSNLHLPEDIKVPCNIPLQVYVIEIVVLLALSKQSLHKCLEMLVKKELYWVCISLITSSHVQFQKSIQATELGYFTQNILPKIECNLIPVEVFEERFSAINGIFHFAVLYKLVCEIFDAGDNQKGPEGIAIKKKAVMLSQILIESILINASVHNKNLVEQLLKTVQEKFSSETAKKLGVTTVVWKQQEVEFVLNPSFQLLESIKNSFGSDNEQEFLRKQETLLQFLKKNCRCFQGASVEIFFKLEMYKDLAECLSGLENYRNYEVVFKKINAGLEEVKNTRNSSSKSRALAEALEKYVTTALVEGSFNPIFRRHTNPIPEQVQECLKLLHSINKGLFLSIVQLAINDVSQMYLKNTVNHQKRTELSRWLLEIKAVFTSVKENKEWSRIMLMVLDGPLRRKPQIITLLRWTKDLM